MITARDWVHVDLRRFATTKAETGAQNHSYELSGDAESQQCDEKYGAHAIYLLLNDNCFLINFSSNFTAFSSP